MALHKPPGSKDISEPETILFKKSKESVSTDVTFCLDGADRGVVDFSDETVSLKIEEEKSPNWCN